MADAVWQRCALTTSSMTVILGWNGLQNWLACPVDAPWTHQALATGSTWAGASAWHRWTRDHDKSRGWSRSCNCTAALPVLQDPSDPWCLLPMHPSTGKHPCCFGHASPRCHGHRAMIVWVGSTRPLHHKDVQTLQLFGFSCSWSSPVMPLPSLHWQWPFLSTSKCHVRLEVRCHLSHHNSRSSPVSPGLR